MNLKTNCSILVIVLVGAWNSSVFGQEISEPIHTSTNERGERIYTTNGYVSTKAQLNQSTERNVKSFEEYSLGELEDFLIQIDEKIIILEDQGDLNTMKQYVDQKTLIQNRILIIKESK